MPNTENTQRITITYRTTRDRKLTAGVRGPIRELAEINLDGRVIETIALTTTLRRRLERQGITVEQYVAERAAAAVLTVEAPDCEGHPAGPFDPMGETVYCDGSCRSAKGL